MNHFKIVKFKIWNILFLVMTTDYSTSYAVPETAVNYYDLLVLIIEIVIKAALNYLSSKKSICK